MVDFNSILDAARQLTETDRARLVDALWSSVPDDSDLPLDTEWERELERRVAALMDRSANTVPWSVIRTEALARIGHAK